MKTLRIAPLLGALLFTLILDVAGPRNAALAQEDRPTMTTELTLDLSGTSESNTVLQNVQAIAELSSLASAIERTDLGDALSGPGPITVFAPVNEAFDLADKEPADLDEDDDERLERILLHHVAEGEMASDNLSEGMTLVMMSGERALINTSSVNPHELNIDDADIVYTDIESSNGVIHLINLVLSPVEGGEVSAD